MNLSNIDNTLIYFQVLTHRQTDHDLALGYLAAMPHQKSLQAMTSLKEKFANRYRRMEVPLTCPLYQ